jgi:hypothetical protein
MLGRNWAYCPGRLWVDAVEKVGGESGWGWLLAFCGKCRADLDFVASPMRAMASMLTPPTDATQLTRRQALAVAG